jgi:hypothetical protein
MALALALTDTSGSPLMHMQTHLLPMAGVPGNPALPGRALRLTRPLMATQTQTGVVAPAATLLSSTSPGWP